MLGLEPAVTAQLASQVDILFSVVESSPELREMFDILEPFIDAMIGQFDKMTGEMRTFLIVLNKKIFKNVMHCIQYLINFINLFSDKLM